VRNPAAQDTYSTTGTTPSGMFVGRASGDETGDVGSSGAEARAEHARRHSRKPEQQRRSE
jgi:hypothetical protein